MSSLVYNLQLVPRTSRRLPMVTALNNAILISRIHTEENIIKLFI